MLFRSPTLNNPCILTPPNICVEQAIYTINKTLPPVSGGYTLVYQRCCRNATIINILDPQDAGSTYMAQIPDVGTYGYNSSPFFNSFPPITVCAGTPLIYDHSATDPDGDQLVYSFCTPYIGADASAPMPHIPTPPPYSTIVWGSSFSVNNQISSSPPMTIGKQRNAAAGAWPRPTVGSVLVRGLSVPCRRSSSARAGARPSRRYDGRCLRRGRGSGGRRRR